MAYLLEIEAEALQKGKKVVVVIHMTKEWL